MTYYTSEFADYDNQQTEKLQNWDERYASEWKLISDTFYANAITGADVEEKWDGYLSEMKKNAGLEEKLEIFGKLPTTEEYYSRAK
jgi:hypothetical protein